MNAAALVNKLNTVLNKVGPMNRTVYKRLITYTGTMDRLIGRYDSSPTFLDTLLTPQPYFERVGREHLPGGHAQAMDMISSGGQVLADDYEFVISPSAMSLAEMENPNIVLVLKDAAGVEEQLRMLDEIRYPVKGVDVIYIAYFRSLNQPVAQ